MALENLRKTLEELRKSLEEILAGSVVDTSYCASDACYDVAYAISRLGFNAVVYDYRSHNYWSQELAGAKLYEKLYGLVGSFLLVVFDDYSAVLFAHPDDLIWGERMKYRRGGCDYYDTNCYFFDISDPSKMQLCRRAVYGAVEKESVATRFLQSFARYILSLSEPVLRIREDSDGCWLTMPRLFGGCKVKLPVYTASVAMSASGVFSDQSSFPLFFYLSLFSLSRFTNHIILPFHFAYHFFRGLRISNMPIIVELLRGVAYVDDEKYKLELLSNAKRDAEQLKKEFPGKEIYILCTQYRVDSNTKTLYCYELSDRKFGFARDAP